MDNKVLICDDHGLGRTALEALLKRDPTVSLVASTSDQQSAVEAAGRYRPHIALVGYEVDEGCGLDLVRWLRSQHRRCRSIILGTRNDDRSLVDGFDSGAHAALDRSCSAQEVLATIGLVATDQRLFDRNIVEAARARLGMQRASKRDTLCYTDRRILDLILLGMTNSQIGLRLHFSPHTIRNRVSDLLRIFEVTNRTQLVFAVQSDGAVDLRNHQRDTGS
jgi:DNA-binding NarL/FixJ family response regulator